jgi:arylsulfatase A-like enzyme/cytochrome c-type biogenesis protein CcmH/NrfG
MQHAFAWRDAPVARVPIIVALLLALAGCSREPAPSPATSTAPLQHVVLITIDTLRTDAVGVYATAPDRGAPTPNIDALALQDGVTFERAYAVAPITLTSHATLLTGRYPPGHGARHNGMRIDLKTPTLAEAFARAGWVTGAFVGAFPLDRRFGLGRGFQTYGDTMPRDARGRPANERPGRMVVDEALAWAARHREDRVFLWVHLFEPHAPYGNPADPAEAQRSAIERYRSDVNEADTQVGRLLSGLGYDRARTLIVIAGDHGEAFGEHGEVSHSVFTYDTTLHVPLIFNRVGFHTGLRDPMPVSLADVAPTIANVAGIGAFDADGRALLDGVIVRGGSPEASRGEDRALYAESFAPLLDFGWSPLRTIRSGRWKYIAAPKPELYDLASDPGEERNLVSTQSAKASELARLVDGISPATLPASTEPEDRDARARLQALGYASGRGDTGGARPDPKDRKELAAQIARVTSGELTGAALERALRDILRADPANPQANVRLGYVLMESNRCAEATTRFAAAIEGHLPSADAHLGLAGCQIAAKNSPAAEQTLRAAQKIEPDNPVVTANLGLVLSDRGQAALAIPELQRALTLDPDLHQARFALALALARAGRRTEAAEQASELLRRLPADAPQRPEVERLLSALR